MRTLTTTLLIIAISAFGAWTAFGAETLKTPPGCKAADGAKAGPEGYADCVIHEKTGIEMILLPAGSFRMGTDDPNASSGAKPAHDATIKRPFYIGKTEVTNGQYRKFLAACPEYKGEDDVDPAYDLYLLHFNGKSVMSYEDNYPVVWVSWGNAKAFCDWAGLQLPSEAQWEYACKAGTTTKYSFGDNDKELYDYAWVDLAAEHHTHPRGHEETQPVGFVRHARQRLGVVRRRLPYVRSRTGRRDAVQRPRCTDQGPARRLVEHRPGRQRSDPVLAVFLCAGKRGALCRRAGRCVAGPRISRRVAAARGRNTLALLCL